MFERLLDKSQHESAKLSTRLAALFASMQKGGDFGADDIAWFNGGLFETVEVLQLVDSEIAVTCRSQTGLERHRAVHFRHAVRART